MKGSLCDAVPAFMSPSLLPGTGPASAFGTCTQTENSLDHVSQPLSPNSIPRPQLRLVHSPCPPNRSYRFAVGSPARRSSSQACFQEHEPPLEGGSPGSPAQVPPLLQPSLCTQMEVDWKHLGWLLSLLPAGSGRSDLHVGGSAQSGFSTGGSPVPGQGFGSTK